ncbi:molybdenum cofactor guanylyltransferase, partial [Flavobacterium sp.]|uniref:molybdenum cofactor guanylyltransferase n=1 Tax=Flavobacterium sp. TaxID=239 RepID=UPI0037A6ED5E
MKTSILCGGKSSRMQSEKGLVLYQNKAFIEHIIDAVLPISKNIQLITNSNDYDYLEYNVVKDLIIDKGPIGGIYSALAQSETELNLILSCDIPLISTEILSELVAKHNSNFDATLFEDANRIHPLIGIYSKKCLSILKKAIDENDLKMMRFLSKISLQKINIEEHKSHLFKNINTIAEL